MKRRRVGEGGRRRWVSARRVTRVTGKAKSKTSGGKQARDNSNTGHEKLGSSLSILLAWNQLGVEGMFLVIREAD